MKNKIKLIGFKVGQSRPTVNKTLKVPEVICMTSIETYNIAFQVCLALVKSDFLSIRRIDD